MQIRALAPDDHAQWLPLWLAYNAFYGRHGDTALPAAVTARTWTRLLAGDGLHALVAGDAGQLLGLAHFLFHPSTSALAPSCYLQDLYTAAPARGRGIGGALIEAVAARARAAGAHRLYWQTHEDNAVARRLYDQVAERSGFIVYRRAL